MPVKIAMRKDTRTWCKYGNCDLEKFEEELQKLDDLWTKLESNWDNPQDIEDVYRVYPLMDTTSALARKMLVVHGTKNHEYQVDIVLPSNQKVKDISNYLFSAEHKFFNGDIKKELLANVVSTFLHASEYVYMDTRTVNNDNDYKIYVFVKTDILCNSCANTNLEKPRINGANYRVSTGFVVYSDCTCGQYVEVRSYINSTKSLLIDKIRASNA